MFTAALPTIIHLAIYLGLPALLAGLVLKLPPVQVHLKSAILSIIINTIGNTAEDVLKSLLTGKDIDGIFTAWSSGTPLRNILVGLLPELKASVSSQLGPALSKLLAWCLNGDEAAAEKIVTSLLSAGHDIIAAKQAAGHAPQPGQVARLADGHLLVVPHGQALPDGSTLVASKP